MTVGNRINPKSILIIRLSSLGDVVLTQPVAAELKRQYPQAEVHYLTKRAFFPVVECFGCVDKVYIWEEVKSFSRLVKLKNRRFDLVIDLHKKLSTYYIKYIVGGKNSLTYNKQHSLREKIVKHRTNDSIASTVELYFSAFRKTGIQFVISKPHLQPTVPIPAGLANKLKRKKIKVAIFPGALHKTKQYPTSNLIEVINRLDEKFQIFILGSDSEKALAKEIVNKVDKSVYDLAGELSISELITFLSEMDIVISNDSGPMHIAAALKRKQIAIFGATHPKLGFSPMNDNAIVLKADLQCQPCSLHGGEKCPQGHFNCMKMIKPEQIVHILNNVDKLKWSKILS